MAFTVNNDAIYDGTDAPLVKRSDAPHLWDVFVAIAAMSAEDVRGVKMIAEARLLSDGIEPEGFGDLRDIRDGVHAALEAAGIER